MNIGTSPAADESFVVTVTERIKAPFLVRGASRATLSILEGEPRWNIYKRQKDKMAAFLSRKAIISASLLLRKAWFGSKLGDSGSRNPCMWIPN